MLQLPKSEKSYWREAYTGSLYPELLDDLEVDVAIVGGGITGLTSAYLLKKSGFTVAVVEKSTIGGGTTGRTTGKVTSQHNLIYDQLQSQHGTDTARLYGEANQAAVERVNKIVTSERIDCGWERADHYVYTAVSSRVGKLNQEAETAAALGLPATFETSVPLPFGVKAAVKFTGQGNLHSQKYLLGLAKAINGKGSYVFENSNVIGIREGNPGRIRTKKARVRAKDIIIATNVPTLPLMARGTYCALEYPTESYIVAGRLPKKLIGMYISPDSAHYSLLPTEHNGERMLLIGGEGHISGLRGSTEARYRRLADYAEKYFGITEITHRWSDRDYLGYDSIPLVGKMYPWSRHLFVGTAFMKWGLSNGTAAAMILHDTISGKQNDWAAVFDSTRLKPVASIPRVAKKYILGK